jgi:hypothetical protein
VFNVVAFVSFLHEICKIKDNSKVCPRTEHEDLEGMYRYSSTISLPLALDGVVGQRHASAALSPGKRPSIHCALGCVDFRVGVDRCGKSRHHRVSIPGPSSPWRFAILAALSRPKCTVNPAFLYQKKF